MKWRRRQRLRQRSQQNVLEMTATLSSQKQAHAYTDIQIHIHTWMHTLKRERERETYKQADKLTNRQTIHAIQQWLSNKACSRKTAGKAGQKDMRLLLLARKCAEGKVTKGGRGGGAVKMRTRMNLEAQIKIISSCL